MCDKKLNKTGCRKWPQGFGSIFSCSGMDERTDKLTFNFFCMLANKPTYTQISVPGNENVKIKGVSGFGDDQCI